MLGSAEMPLKVVIVGSGPSGFYAAEELLQSPQAIEVTMVERLPVPFGLVRNGVAPDHPKLKQPTIVYDRIARLAQFHFLGNVKVGRDVGVTDLLDTHHAVILACGAERERRLGIPGEQLPGNYPAAHFVGWYNGHPDFRSLIFDFSHEVAVVIGQGNVALDVARIMLKSADELRHTDIAEHALEALAASRVREIHIVGRRGPAQAKFTPQELTEIGTISGCRAVADPEELVLNQASTIEISDKFSRSIAKNSEIFRRFALTQARKGDKVCYFHFYRNPKEILGDRRVEGVRFARTALVGEPFKQVPVDTGNLIDLPCGIVFQSVGFAGVPLDGLPFDHASGIIPNCNGRLIDAQGNPLYGLYASGWVKRGATGIIGTNRADSVETIATLLSDLPRFDPRHKAGYPGLEAKLEARGTRYVTYNEWLRIDDVEVREGQAKGKPREKLTTVEAMLAECTSAAAGH